MREIVNMKEGVQDTSGAKKRMTVRKVADVLGVTDEAIKKHIRALYPNLMKERATTLLNEEQITEIKRRMRLTTKVVSSITDMEAAEMLVKSAEHFKARFEEMKERARKLEMVNDYLNKTLTDIRQLSDSRAEGLEAYQRMAEAGGLVLSDRDDVAATYRRR